MLWRLDTLLEESVNYKNLHIDMVSLHEEEEEEEEPNGRWKEQQDTQAPYSSEPQKAHLISEFVVVA